MTPGTITAVNFDIPLLAVVVGAVVLLGIVVFRRGESDATRTFFLIFSLVSASWSVANYATYQIEHPVWALLAVRIVMFFAVWQAFTFFLLIHTFPHPRIQLSRRIFLALCILCLCVSGLTL